MIQICPFQLMHQSFATTSPSGPGNSLAISQHCGDKAEVKTLQLSPAMPPPFPALGAVVANDWCIIYYPVFVKSFSCQSAVWQNAIFSQVSCNCTTSQENLILGFSTRFVAKLYLNLGGLLVTRQIGNTSTGWGGGGGGGMRQEGN